MCGHERAYPHVGAHYQILVRRKYVLELLTSVFIQRKVPHRTMLVTLGHLFRQSSHHVHWPTAHSMHHRVDVSKMGREWCLRRGNGRHHRRMGEYCGARGLRNHHHLRRLGNRDRSVDGVNGLRNHHRMHHNRHLRPMSDNWRIAGSNLK